jgi:hypothetical protein
MRMPHHLQCRLRHVVGCHDVGHPRGHTPLPIPHSSVFPVRSSVTAPNNPYTLPWPAFSHQRSRTDGSPGAEAMLVG